MGVDQSLSLDADGTFRHPGKRSSDGIRSSCRRCSGDIGEPYLVNCHHCGHIDEPNCVCRACGGGLRAVQVRVTAFGTEAGSATRMLDGLVCEACKTTSVYGFHLDHLSETANLAREAVELVDELGIFGKSAVEIFSPFDVHEGDDASASLEGIEVTIGSQSELFAETGPHLSELDNGLISSMGSLRVIPGPPYSVQQRATIEVLLATLRVNVGSAMDRYGHDERNPFRRVVGQLAAWPADEDRIALSLCNAILDETPPGALMNAFRLVEVMLDRWWRREALTRRSDARSSDAEFLTFVGDFPRKRLDDKLIARVEALRVSPSPVVDRLATLLSVRGTGYKAVLKALVQFRNDHAHGPDWGGKLVLPWEHPNYHACIAELVRLIGCLLDDEGIEPNLPSITYAARNDDDD